MNYLFNLGVLVALFCSGHSNPVSNRKFPIDFKFGAATAAYQVEGAWNEDGKGENIWDRIIHTNPSSVKNNDTADKACDSYHKYKEDVQLLKNLGVNHYRFSLSWSRILPTGFTNRINEKAVAYYRNLIRELKSNGIEPLVTIFHWDLPQPLQDIGGWPNDVLVELYADYARTVFGLFGEEVKSWLTFNEVKQICHEGYGIATKAPSITSPGVGEYLCSHVVIKAHAAAYHIYETEFKEKQGGEVGIAIDTDWYEPGTNSTEDIEASERSLQFRWGWYVHPLVFGDYPKIMINRVAKRSKEEGFSKSRLPVFSQKEIKFTKGTYDFLALNHYSSFMVKHGPEPKIGTPSWDNDMGTTLYRDPNWETAASDWLYVTPFGMRKVLNWIKKNYNNPRIIITENGYSDSDGRLNDVKRINYLRGYLSNILDAIYEDKVRVFGYTVWSFLDNFEWFSGYTERFGIYQVDFNDENRTRRAKLSAKFYKNLILTRCLAENCT